MASPGYGRHNGAPTTNQSTRQCSTKTVGPYRPQPISTKATDSRWDLVRKDSQCSFNAEESEAAARKYCEGFTARVSVCGCRAPRRLPERAVHHFNVRVWHLADITTVFSDVRFWGFTTTGALKCKLCLFHLGYWRGLLPQNPAG